ncbi:nitrate reductase [Chloropicon primus]|uniref:Nitrate reductase n=2 Tax=Chloropicon primus TaxID=1764295 RepID=A0A5B8ME01_9CHLO|nr:nitrate reductase [Chloropicon primus]UPQ97867.1 nitrate reductase [Chloropicon primus]|eukprot:QDZ18659.1 nitrate reductase [Chloropicon primus]
MLDKIVSSCLSPVLSQEKREKRRENRAFRELVNKEKEIGMGGSASGAGHQNERSATLPDYLERPTVDRGDLPTKFPEERIKEVDDKDKGTPDEWVPRHPELIRLTGRHPLNCEPPLTRNYEAGFFLPASLHFVRNHGACPQLNWDDHKIKIHGLVDRPMEITMDQLAMMPTVRVPITMVCAGNRRREENMIKKTIGFSWGASACSTSVWTGVRLGDLLRLCGVRTRAQGANHVCFVGADPLPKDNYGTSMKIERALDPAYDVLIAFEQNGKRLLPDHGYPVRLIIPGYIGGRMVKWLTEIEVTENESTNYYHYFDNRVLPSHVDAERATAEGWWYKPEYIINDLNINSAMVYPQHDEILKLSGSDGQKYTLKGYAYSGGGRKVIRSEISFDDGKTWNLAKLKHTEKPNAYGKYWCWCHWELEINVLDLVGIEEISLRSWDEGMNCQPKDITWNVMGMMNNCHFRVKVHPIKHEGALALQFEHPTVAANGPGGWMVPKKSEPESAPAPKAPEPAKKPVPKGPGGATFTLEEISKHNTKESAWFVHDGKVYDATEYLEDHPGGAESILITAGQDATEEFDAIHSTKARALLDKYYIGEVGDSTSDASSARSSTSSEVVTEVKQLVALDKTKRIPFKLVEKHVLSHDTRRFRFALQSPEHILGLPVGNHMLLAGRVDGKLVMRAYTPTSSDDDVGYFDLVIKVYFKGVHPKFPDGGILSQHFESLEIGDTMEVKGPIGHVTYHEKGNFTVHGKDVKLNEVGFICGGTGITPAYQIIKAITKDKKDKTKAYLIYANKTEDDILLREELDELAAKYPKKFKLHYTLDDPPKGWKHSQGFINEDMIKRHMPSYNKKAMVMMCGPPPMIKYACVPNLEKNGFPEGSYLSF